MSFPVFAVVLTLVAAGLLIRELLFLRWGRQSESWPHTEGTIVSARSRQIGDIHSTQYTLSVRYQYEVQGAVYTSRRHSYGRRYITSLYSATRAAAEYPAGATVPVYYNPKNPRMATLEPGVDWGNLIIVGACLVALVFGLRSLLARL